MRGIILAGASGSPLKIGCVEEVAFQQGDIDANQLAAIAHPLRKSGYGE